MNFEVVIDYWFGGDRGTNYKKKWFPSSSASSIGTEDSMQMAADEEITSRFEEYLTHALDNNLNHWISSNGSEDSAMSIDGVIAMIIVVDQFSRHIYRYRKLSADAAERSHADSIAFELAKKLHTNPNYQNELLNLPLDKYIFSLMPFRHNASVENLSFALERTRIKEEHDSKSTAFCDELLQKFRKQTIRRLQHLQDREMLEADDDILEHLPFDADESTIMSHPLVKTIDGFLRRHIQCPSTDLFISLSGGVDSMVIAKILKRLQTFYMKSNKEALQIRNIMAMHIDYANRPESGREAAFVQQWCHQQGLQCQVRVVDEVTRGVTARDEYEKVARDIRYQFYKVCMAGVAAGSGPVGVIFGHHQGDVQENVISNVMRGCSPLFLSGMTETSVTNGVTVWRPLLPHRKDDIFAFAHKYGVPYFKDSTPSWSTRGKLRRQLLPLLLDMYGDGCLRNLSSLARDSDEARQMVSRTVYSPFFDSVRHSPCGLAVNVLPFLEQPSSFWREALKGLMHSMAMSLVRDKAVDNFVERLQKLAALEKNLQLEKGLASLSGWLELRKGYHSLLSPQGELLLLRDGVLRGTLKNTNPATTRNQLQQRRPKKKREEKKGGKKRERSQREEGLEGLDLFGLDAEEGLGLGDMAGSGEQVETEQRPGEQIEQEGDEKEGTEMRLELLLSVCVPSEGEERSPVRIQCDAAQLRLFSATHFQTPANASLSSDQLWLGPWRVTISAAVSLNRHVTDITGGSWPLKNPSDLMTGSFDYTLIVPYTSYSSLEATPASIELRLRLLWDVIEEEDSEIDRHATLECLQTLLGFKEMDHRLRFGLPLLAIVIMPEEISFDRLIRVHFHYDYVQVEK